MQPEKEINGKLYQPTPCDGTPPTNDLRWCSLCDVSELCEDSEDFVPDCTKENVHYKEIGCE